MAGPPARARRWPMGALWSHPTAALALPGLLEVGAEQGLGCRPGAQQQWRGFRVSPSLGWCFSSVWHKMSVLPKERPPVPSHRTAWPAPGAPSPSPWGPQPGALPGCSRAPDVVPPAGTDPPGLLPTDGDAPRAAGLSQLRGLRSFSFGDATRHSGNPGPTGITWDDSRSLEKEGGGGSAPSPHPMALPSLPLAVPPPSLWCAGDGELLSPGRHPSRRG